MPEKCSHGERCVDGAPASQWTLARTPTTKVQWFGYSARTSVDDVTRMARSMLYRAGLVMPNREDRE